MAPNVRLLEYLLRGLLVLALAMPALVRAAGAPAACASAAAAACCQTASATPDTERQPPPAAPCSDDGSLPCCCAGATAVVADFADGLPVPSAARPDLPGSQLLPDYLGLKGIFQPPRA